MIASSKTMDALRTIGLNKYERNLWAGLLSRGSSTAGELSSISNVPRSRCYDVLQSLSDKGFIILQPGKPMKYVAMHPKEALERAKKKIQEDKNEICDKIDRLMKSDSIKELEKLHKENIKTIQPEHLTGALRGRYAMMQQLETMFKKAKKSISLMTTESGLNELSENHSNVLKKVSNSGVNIRIAAPVSKNSESTKELLKYADIRNIDKQKLFGRLCVIDGTEFLLGLTDDTKTHPTQDVALWTQSSHATSSILNPMFEMVWNNSKQVK